MEHAVTPATASAATATRAIGQYRPVLPYDKRCQNPSRGVSDPERRDMTHYVTMSVESELSFR